MSRFIYEVGQCISYFAQFMSYFTNSFWIYPALFFIFSSIILYIITDNR